ncbi:hypothetical protein F8388_004020 [Cannabis sativa]|uniref:Pectinesterase inhibitor domain-containing protein n=1 Tax=Cannabis sativa TaxID=3483 RepID=A0A7J6I179_CANSA|nr:hypothetical protein F8388_004020 [Cannabis sativa]KAF4401146.1 hypothetical protein G4B88_013987 [Cannabis sativa]
MERYIYLTRLSLSLISSFLILFYTSTTAQTTIPRRSRTRAYIEVSCQITEYQDLCIRSLTAYIHSSNTTILSPRQLVHYALLASQHRAQHTTTFLLQVSKPLVKAKKEREYQAVKDCLEQIDMCVDQLSMSIKELRQLGREETTRENVDWHIGNVETWVGSALTDATTCLDEFPAGVRMSKMKATVKAKVLNVAQVTENALALFHHFVVRHRAPGPPQNP